MTSSAKSVGIALPESVRYLHTSGTDVPIIMFTLDCKGVFTRAEGKGLEALALRSDEVVELPVFELYGDEPQILENIRRALAGKSLARPS
jgi:hypothetical protein